MEAQLATDKITSGAHTSWWTDSEHLLKYQPLAQDIHTEVAVIGAGISGLTTAYCLCKAGKKVVVIEDGYIGSGETGRTTGHLVNALDDRYYELERIFGEEGAKLAAESHTKAIEKVEQIVRMENIPCRFKRVDGYLVRHPSDKEDVLEKEMEAARKAGIMVEMVDSAPGMIKQNGPALKFPNQARFHATRYLEGLCAAILESGGQIFTETHVKEIHPDKIITDTGLTVKASDIVVATNAPVNSFFQIPSKQFPYRTYVIAAMVQKVLLPDALWWDTGNYEVNSDIPPYHYVRLEEYDEGHYLLISGGEDHATGLADAEGITEENRYALLESWTAEHFPIGRIMYRWSGQVMETMDSLAFIGKSPGQDNIYIITGDSGNGLTHGTIGGMLITDLITGTPNPWEKLYNPSRFKFFKSGGLLMKEFAGMVVKYLKTLPFGSGKENAENLEKGEGKIIKIEGSNCGVYRDENNMLHIVSATCTHMGCVVKWNNDEKTWDCPCHGSRFSHEGKVLNGPANTDLDYHSEAFGE